MSRHSDENHKYAHPLQDTGSVFNEIINHGYRNDNNLNTKKKEGHKSIKNFKI